MTSLPKSLAQTWDAERLTADTDPALQALELQRQASARPPMLPPIGGTPEPMPTAQAPAAPVEDNTPVDFSKGIPTMADLGFPDAPQAPMSPPAGQSGTPQAMPTVGGSSGGASAPAAYSGTSAPAGDGEIEQYIRQAAAQRGIDPDIAVAVANSEGGVSEPARRGTFNTGSSWWPFQLHYGGAGTPYESLGDTAGMGNDFTAKTGIQPGDPNGWRQSVDYALDQAKAGGWGPWYGAKAIGVTGFQGIGQGQGSAAMLADNAPERSVPNPMTSANGVGSVHETPTPGAGGQNATIKGMPVADALAMGGQFQLGGPDDGSGSNGVDSGQDYSQSGPFLGDVANDGGTAGPLAAPGGPSDSGGTSPAVPGMASGSYQESAPTPTRDDWRTNPGVTPDLSASPPSGAAEADPGGGAASSPPVEQPNFAERIGSAITDFITHLTGGAPQANAPVDGRGGANQAGAESQGSTSDYASNAGLLEAPQRPATPENFNLPAAEHAAQNAATVLPDASLSGMQAANAGFEQARQAPISFADTMREQTDTETQRGNELTQKWIAGTITPDEYDEWIAITGREGANVAGNGIETEGANVAKGAARRTVPEMASGVVSGAGDAGQQYDRYYHGTGGDFARPDPGKFDPNGLFGPALYITDEPVVAGGQIAKGGEPYPKPDTDYLARGGGWRRPYDAGEVIGEGYAQSGRGGGPDFEGANVRPIDVPRDLNLLDADAPVSPDVRDSVRAALNRTIGVSEDSPSLAISQAKTGNDLYQAVVGNLTNGYQRDVAHRADEYKQVATQVLADAGYDGIKYAGGNRIPMKDADGNAIQHNAIAIFPESLDKIRNAVAGTPGGFVPRTPPGRGSSQAVDEAMVKMGTQALQGGVAGAYGEYQNDPNATPQSIAKSAAVGATQRVLLGNARGALGGKGAGVLSRAVKAGTRAAQAASESLPINMTEDQEITRLNLGKLIPPGTDPEIADVITNAARDGGWYHEARRGVRPDKLVDAEAAALNDARSVDDWIRGSRPGRAYNDTEIVALRNAYLNQGAVVSDLEKQLKETPFTFAQDAEKQALQANYLIEMKKLEALGKVASGGAMAEGGRTLRQLGRLAQVIKADPLDGARKTIDTLYGSSENAKEAMDNFMAMKAQGATPQELAGYLRNLGALNPLERWGNRAQIFRYANMLWGTVTHLTNLGTTLGKQFGDAAVIKPIAVGMDMARNALDHAYTTEPYIGRQVFMGEIPPQLHAIGAGLINGLREVPEILRTGVTKEEATRLDRVHQGFGAHIPGIGEKSVPWLGDVNELVNFGAEAPLRALQAEDAFTKSGARAGHVAELATRQALQEGLKGPAVGKRALEIISDPGKNWRLFDKAEELTQHDAFQEKRALSDALLNMRGIKGLPGMFAQALMPFVKTPTNIAAQGLDMTPLGLKTVYDAAHAGGPHAIADAEMAASRAVFGSGIMALSAYAGANGLMTTDYPDGPERTTLPQGWKPWSFKIPMADGKTAYVSYSNMGPIGFPLAIGALMAHGAASGEDVTKWAPEAAIKVGKYTADMTFLQGISQFAQVLTGGADARAENFVEGMATQWAPAASMGRQIQQAMGMASRDPHGAWEALMATYPGIAGNVPARQDSLGRDQVPTQTGLGAVLVPVRYGVSQPDPTLDAYRNAGVGLPAPPKKMDGFDLTRSEQAQYQRMFGEELQKIVSRSTGTGSLNRASPKVQQDLLDGYKNDARDAVEARMIREVLGHEEYKRRIKESALAGAQK